MSVTDDVFGPQKDRERRVVANPVDYMVRADRKQGLLSAEDVRQIITEKIKELSSQRAFAKHAGVSAAYVNDYLQGYRAAGKALLTAVGLEKVEMYQRIQH